VRRPATFDAPRWFLINAWRMCGLFLTAHLSAELTRHAIRARSRESDQRKRHPSPPRSRVPREQPLLNLRRGDEQFFVGVVRRQSLPSAIATSKPVPRAFRWIGSWRKARWIGSELERPLLFVKRIGEVAARGSALTERFLERGVQGTSPSALRAATPTACRGRTGWDERETQRPLLFAKRIGEVAARSSALTERFLERGVQGNLPVRAARGHPYRVPRQEGMG